MRIRLASTEKTRYIILRSFFYIALIVLWQLVCSLFSVSPYLLPAPSAIIKELVYGFDLILPHLKATLITGLGGFFISIVVGFFIALILDFSASIKALVYPILVVSQTIPIIFMYPLFLIWLGYGMASKLFVVILVCFFPISVSLTDGLASTDKELLLLFRSFNASRLKTFFYLRFPSALPLFFSGLKIAATYSIMGAVIGEWLGASRGLGVYMMRAYKTFSTARVFAAIIVVVAASLIVVYLVKKTEQLVLPWLAGRDSYSAEKNREIPEL